MQSTYFSQYLVAIKRHGGKESRWLQRAWTFGLFHPEVAGLLCLHASTHQTGLSKDPQQWGAAVATWRPWRLESSTTRESKGGPAYIPSLSENIKLFLFKDFKWL